MHEPQHNTHYLLPHSPPCIPQNSHNSPSLAFSLRFLTPSLFCVPTLFRYICQQQWLVVHLSMPFFFVCSCLCLSGGSFSFSSLVCDDEISGLGHFELTGLEAKDLVFLLLAFLGVLNFLVKCVCLVCVVCGQMGLSSLSPPPSKKGGRLMWLTSTRGERLGLFS